MNGITDLPLISIPVLSCIKRDIMFHKRCFEADLQCGKCNGHNAASKPCLLIQVLYVMVQKRRKWLFPKVSQPPQQLRWPNHCFIKRCPELRWQPSHNNPMFAAPLKPRLCIVEKRWTFWPGGKGDPWSKSGEWSCFWVSFRRDHYKISQEMVAAQPIIQRAKAPEVIACNMFSLVLSSSPLSFRGSRCTIAGVIYIYIYGIYIYVYIYIHGVYICVYMFMLWYWLSQWYLEYPFGKHEAQKTDAPWTFRCLILHIGQTALHIAAAVFCSRPTLRRIPKNPARSDHQEPHVSMRMCIYIYTPMCKNKYVHIYIYM